MPINAFQAGQLFNVTRAQQEQTLLERQRREQGINALAGMFGEGALAPQAFATVTTAERGERIFQANEAQRRVVNERNVQLDAGEAAQRKVLNDRAERIFADDKKFRGIVAELNERKFGASQDHIAVLEDLAERQFISKEAALQIQQELARDSFISLDSQRTIFAALNERKFQSSETQQGVSNLQIDRDFEAGQTQQGVANLQKDRVFEAGEIQRGIENRQFERGVDISEDQRKIKNERDLREDDQTAQEIEEKTKSNIAKAAIGFLRAGQANNTPPAETVTRLTPALKQLGWTDEMIGDLPQQLANNPNFINELEGALEASKASKEKRLISTLPVRNADGSTGLIQFFSDGSTRPVPGVTPLREEIKGRRVDVAEARIDPTKRGEIKEEEVIGKARGEVIAADLPSSRTEIASQRAKIRSMTDTTDRAIGALDNAIKQIGLTSTGFIGGVTQFIPGTPSFKLVKRLLPVVAQEFVTNLQNMRDLSKTGGAVGNVSNAEGDKLGALNASLDIGVGPKQLREEIEILLDAIETSRNNVERAFQEDQAARKTLKPARTDIDDLLDKFAPIGGQ